MTKEVTAWTVDVTATMLSIEHEGVSYLAGTAGSLILSCPKCGKDQFRNKSDYFAHPEWHTCINCRILVEPVKMVELESRWVPIWEKTDRR